MIRPHYLILLRSRVGRALPNRVQYGCGLVDWKLVAMTLGEQVAGLHRAVKESRERRLIERRGRQ